MSPASSLVSPLVADEAGLLAEALVALVAVEWPLSGVDSLVLDQHRVLDEALVALVALVGPLSGVRTLVSDQVRVTTEAFGAVGALIRPLPGVDTVVFDQVGLHGEAFIALGAFVRPQVAAIAGVGAGAQEGFIEEPPAVRALYRVHRGGRALCAFIGIGLLIGGRLSGHPGRCRIESPIK